MGKIGVVIVTFNRLEKLKTALECFEQQTVKPAYLLVVDNASTDGTVEYLKSWQDAPGAFSRQVVFSPENTGGSGGFHMGLAAARQLDAPWIWLSDDDAFPETDALEKTEAFLASPPCLEAEISAVCGAVINNGSYDLEHRRTIARQGLRVVEQSCPAENYEKPWFALDTVSYVGIIIRKGALDTAGITEKGFFIWFDDTEHSLRLGKAGKMFCISGVRIHHDMATTQTELNWKQYYGIRNKLIAIRRHFPRPCFAYSCASCTFRALVDLIHGGQRRKRGKLTLAAIRDARREKLGLHETYRPGWKP